MNDNGDVARTFFPLSALSGSHARTRAAVLLRYGRRRRHYRSPRPNRTTTATTTTANTTTTDGTRTNYNGNSTRSLAAAAGYLDRADGLRHDSQTAATAAAVNDRGRRRPTVINEKNENKKRK